MGNVGDGSACPNGLNDDGGGDQVVFTVSCRWARQVVVVVFGRGTPLPPPWMDFLSAVLFAAYGGETSAFLNNTCTGGKNAVVIFGNDQHKTYGGTFTAASSTRVQGNRGMDKPCYFDVDFPGHATCDPA